MSGPTLCIEMQSMHCCIEQNFSESKRKQKMIENSNAETDRWMGREGEVKRAGQKHDSAAAAKR